MATLGQNVKAVSVMKFSHFDEPVTVAAPAAADTVPFSSVPQFFSRLGASTAGSGLDA